MPSGATRPLCPLRPSLGRGEDGGGGKEGRVADEDKGGAGGIGGERMRGRGSGLGRTGDWQMEGRAGMWRRKGGDE